jgi:hypothetical protein
MPSPAPSTRHMILATRTPQPLIAHEHTTPRYRPRAPGACTPCALPPTTSPETLHRILVTSPCACHASCNDSCNVRACCRAVGARQPAAAHLCLHREALQHAELCRHPACHQSARGGRRRLQARGLPPCCRRCCCCPPHCCCLCCCPSCSCSSHRPCRCGPSCGCPALHDEHVLATQLPIHRCSPTTAAIAATCSGGVAVRLRPGRPSVDRPPALTHTPPLRVGRTRADA